MRKPLPDWMTSDFLNDRLRYDPVTGRLFNRRRTANSRPENSEAFGAQNGNGYRRECITGPDGVCVYVLAHVVVLAMHGVTLRDSDEPDHINGDRSDNRMENLRVVSRSTNCKNRALRSDSTSGYPGVHFKKKTGRWQAYAVSNGIQVHLGYFDTRGEAVAARGAVEAGLSYHANHGRKRSNT